MKKPTINQLMNNNPDFFHSDDDDINKLQADKERHVVREGDEWVLKLLTAGDTTPVYKIGPNLFLSYLRDKW